MELTGEAYRIVYDPATTTVTCEGNLRLYGAGGFLSMTAFEQQHLSQGQPQSFAETEKKRDASILDLFYTVADQKPASITLNVHRLESLNSSGINAFSKFVLKVRQDHASQLTIQGNRKYVWQGKVLGNLQKLMPALHLEWV
jgi:hypothetical protein